MCACVRVCVKVAVAVAFVLDFHQRVYSHVCQAFLRQIIPLQPYFHLRSSSTMHITRVSVSFGPRREKTCLRGFANNTGADQPAHPRSLISTFVIRFLESTIFNLATDEISIF